MVFLKIPVGSKDGSVKILVVDDDQSFLDVVEATLKLRGIQVSLAKSGYEAIDFLKNNSADLVIADYRMQNGDGVSLSHYCAKQGVPCIVFTGSLPEVVKHYLPQGTPVIEKVACFEPDGILGALAPHLAA